ncbi:hypothetical protein Mycch_5998 (plasmid) [Mycolicibacterium chubuense NBB4]|uniref:Uncharacterized protein n=1 Tax=Mycolicibacterium chubuense (strain NBB4) TaxID=710421 RepID=I4BTJ3_MYCCN|nr:hypothetical protein [Mycolicibacterium chubuense]AFM20600.1 hypothetical protein Mycch_5998 [Mycolicibacterium chubuense NBB4]
MTAIVERAVLTAEAPAIMAWAARADWTVRFDADGRTLTASTIHPVTRTVVVFHADLEGYPAIPPAWSCRNADGAVTPSAFPLPGSRTGIPGSIFHAAMLICAPWNRLAYGVHGGPHTDWTVLTEWKTVPGGVTKAHTLADMLSAIALNLAASPGTAAP